METSLRNAASRISSPVEKRLFEEYGAIFATTAKPPPVILFANSTEVEVFQASLSISSALLGDYDIALQTEALDALVAAASEIVQQGKSITARAADAGGRSYEDTLRLWTRNVTRGLEHWEEVGRISRDLADSIRRLNPADQVATILSMEENEQLFFGTFFDKSILYSVAVPGASQHLSMLAFDVAEYADREVESVLARHRWYRTVLHDLPHFSYLGHSETRLPDLGLHRIERTYPERMYDFWTPCLDRL